MRSAPCASKRNLIGSSHCISFGWIEGEFSCVRTITRITGCPSSESDWQGTGGRKHNPGDSLPQSVIGEVYHIASVGERDRFPGQSAKTNKGIDRGHLLASILRFGAVNQVVPLNHNINHAFARGDLRRSAPGQRCSAMLPLPPDVYGHGQRYQQQGANYP
jgi:hypothetical protein